MVDAELFADEVQGHAGFGVLGIESCLIIDDHALNLENSGDAERECGKPDREDGPVVPNYGAS